jgi:membrane protein YqaA with SNARE-associated domain
MASKRKQFATLGLLITFFVVSLFAMSYLAREFLGALITSEASVYGFVFIFIIAGILEFVPQYIAPHLILLNVAFLDIPLITITFVVIGGSAIGSIFGFEFGKKYGLDLTFKWFGKKRVEDIEEKINEYGKWLVAFAAISPIPYVPIIFGSLGMSRNNFIFYGMLPRAIGYLLLGFGSGILF